MLKKEEIHYVFSYGTLKDKMHNSNAKEATLEACMKEGNYGPFPMLEHSTSAIPQIFHGYLLELTQAELDRTDRYEGYPDIYDRIEVIVTSQGKEYKAWLYIKPRK